MAKYSLSEKEDNDAKTFIKLHKECKAKYGRNELFKYVFTPNGIGVEVHIVCPYCGEEKDITDVSCW